MKIKEKIEININTEEIWRDIAGYKGYYQISNFGRVKSLTRNTNNKNIKERILKQVNSYGYRRVGLRINNTQKIYRVHRLVAFTFISKPINKNIINHIDGIKYNNVVNNLEWCTTSENVAHAIKMGLTDSKGEKYGLSKLTEAEVLKIRNLYDKSNNTYNKLGKVFNVSGGTISDIIKRRTWKHI